MASGSRLTPEILRAMLQAGTEAGNKLDVDEPLLTLPEDPLEQAMLDIEVSDVGPALL